MRSRDADHVVGALIRARRRDEKLTAESEAGQLIRRHVRSIEDGFEIQNRTIKNRSLGNVAAWKVGPARKPDFEPWVRVISSPTSRTRSSSHFVRFSYAGSLRTRNGSHI